MHPLERLLNLIALLLEARRPLTFEEIRAKLPAYEQEDLATAKRMFERDKDVLRDVGVPVELRPTDVWEVEEGYFVDKERYYLPEIEFTADEASALFVVATLPGQESPAGEGVRKLLFGVDASRLAGPSTAGPLVVSPDPATDALGVVAEAIQAGRSVRFGYRTAQGVTAERHVDPHGLVARAGRWYLVGRDRDREEIRAFRLSRVSSAMEPDDEAAPPPEDFHAAEHVHAGPWEATSERARVLLSPDVGWWAVRQTPGATLERTRSDGWVEVSLPGVVNALTPWVLSFGPDAEALEPAELRDIVRTRLEAIVAEG